MTDPNTLAVAALTDELRIWLRARREPPPIQASALVYELAALIARDAGTVGDAHRLVEYWATVMKEQITAFGVGQEHQ